MRRYPYHRYLTHLVLGGDDNDVIAEHLTELEYLPPTNDEIDELRELLFRRPVSAARRQELGVTFLNEYSPSLEQAMWIVEHPPVRTCAERLLLDRVHPKHITTILSVKFNEDLTTKAVEMFRDGFWDTSVMKPMDFSAYFRRAGSRKPDPPPEAVSLATRSAYAKWKHGLYPDDEELSPDRMVREIRMDSFMRFKEESSGPSGDPKMAKAWAELALKTAGAAKALADGRKGKSDVIPDLKPKMHFPNHTTPTLGDLHCEYSETMSGTGSVSATAGSREEGGEEPA